MSATGFHPEPSAKAPWTRTMVLTAAYAGDDAARAAPVRRARIKRFMLQLHNAPPHCLPGEGIAPTVTAGNYSRELRQAKWVQSSFCAAAIQRRSCSSGREPGEDQMGIPPIAVRSPKPRARLELTTPSPAEPRWRQPPPRSPPKNQSADAANFSVVRDRPALMAAEARKMRPSWRLG